MAIRINSGAQATGSFDLPDYPFTMLCYFQADSSEALQAHIFRLSDTGTVSKQYLTVHSSVDELVVQSAPNATQSIRKVDAINPIDTDFTTWWAVMQSMSADGLIHTHNVWSGVGLSPLHYTGNLVSETPLDGFFLPVQTAHIGPAFSKYINVSEVALIDRVLTTGELNSWAHGVPAPEANLPGNIIFYQPLVTGYNEPTSIGTIAFTGVGEPTIESVVGPVMFTDDQITTTTGNINILTQWSQIDVSTGGGVISTDLGQLSSNNIFSSGVGLGQISNLFHITITGISGVPDVYNLMDLSDSHINITLNRDFNVIKAISVQNLSTDIGQYLDFDVSSSSGFSNMFAEPSQPIVLNPKSCLHRVDAGTGYLVSDTNKIIEITPQSTGVVYEMVILGN